MNRRDRLEKLGCLRNRHVQHFGNIFALVQDLKGLTVIACAITDFTRNIHIRQEVHFNLDGAIALAGFTATALNVEAKPAGLVSTHLGLLGFGKKVTDLVEHARISSRVRPGGTPNRRLVNLHEFVQVLNAFHAHRAPRHLAGAVKLIRQGLSQNLVDHRGFTRTRHTGNTHQNAQWDFHVDVFQVIFVRSDDLQHAFFVDLATSIWDT